jgi:hypothetical protein
MIADQEETKTFETRRNRGSGGMENNRMIARDHVIAGSEKQKFTADQR